MYPDLSYFFHDLLGTAPDNWLSVFKTFGLLLVLAILSSARVLYIEFLRMERAGILQAVTVKRTENKAPGWSEYLSNGIFGFILGFKIVYALRHFAEFQSDAAAVILSTKGDWLGGIVMAAILLGYKWWEGSKLKSIAPVTREVAVFPHDRIGDITFIAAISGVIGAKVFSILEAPPSSFKALLEALFSGSGLTIYGGLIFGFLGVSWYLRKHKIPLIHVLDAVAPALIIGYAVGRLGCQFAGDGDWGIVAGPEPSWWFLPHWLWAYDYPHNIISEGIPIEGCTFKYCNHLAQGVYPTPFYESMMAFTIAGILWAVRKRMPAPGMVFFLYLALNGLERFWIEKIRVNERYHFWGMNPTQAEIIAVILFVIGIAGLFVLWRRSKTKA